MNKFFRKLFTFALAVALVLAPAAGDVFAAPTGGHLGDVRDEASLGSVHSAMQRILTAELDHPDALALFAVGEQAFELLDPEVFTGYSVKNKAEAAGYDGARTVRYGHADDWHLIEFVTLMRHYGLNPRLSVESRVSSYVHYYEWGTPDPGVTVRPIDDERAYIYVKEYDALFEFDEEDDATTLDEFILAYAQKETGEEDRHDLLRGSWYVPLYSTVQARPGYRALKEVRLNYGDHYLVNYVLPEHATTIVAGLEQLTDADYEAEVNDIWVNETFYEYILGD